MYNIVYQNCFNTVRAMRIVMTDNVLVSFPDTAEFICKVRCSSLQFVMLTR